MKKILLTAAILAVIATGLVGCNRGGDTTGSTDGTNLMNQAGTNVSEAASGLGEGVSDVGDDLSKGASRVGEGLSDVGDDLSRGASKVGEGVSKALS